MLKLLYTIFFLIISLFSFTQTDFKTEHKQIISGFVLDKKENPVQFAYVTVDNSTITTLTDSKGYFIFERSFTNSVSVTVTCHGYEDAKIKAVPGQQTIVVLTEKFNYLDEVVVTGTRTERTLKDTPVLTKVISSSDLQAAGSVTALDALENLLPGVHFDPSSTMGDNIQVQGLDNNYILILVDGERLVPERKESVNFSRLNVADIERVEIVNGASSVLYGSNAIGSVINIITKKVNKPLEGYVQARYSKFNTLNADASVGFMVKGLSSKTTVNFKTTDGYDLTPESPTTYTVNPNNDISVSQNFDYRFNKKLDASVGGSYYMHNIYNPPASAAATRNRDNNYMLNAKLNYIITDKNFISGSAHTDIFKSYKVYERRNDSASLDGDYYYSTIRVTDTWTISEKYQMIGGIEYNDERTYSSRLFGPSDDGQNKTAGNANAFLQGTINIIKNLDGVAGLRYTNHSGFGSRLSPSVSVMYKLYGFRLRTGINGGFKAPTLKEMYYNFNMAGMFDIIGNPDLEAETSWYKFVSAEYLENNFNASLSLSHNQISNKINIVERFITDELGNQRRQMHYQNIDDVSILAIDAFVQCRVFNYLHLKAAYSFADAKDNNTGNQILGNSKHNMTSSIGFRYPKLKIGKKHYPFILALTGRFSSPRIYESEEVNEEGTTIVYDNSQAFYVVNFTYTQKIPVSGRWNTEIQAGIDNIFDHVDDKTLSSINPGRRFSIMARFNF